MALPFLSDFLDNVFSHADSRVAHWPLMGSLAYPLSFIAIYLSLIYYWAPIIMESIRKEDEDEESKRIANVMFTLRIYNTINLMVNLGLGISVKIN